VRWALVAAIVVLVVTQRRHWRSFIRVGRDKALRRARVLRWRAYWYFAMAAIVAGLGATWHTGVVRLVLYAVALVLAAGGGSNLMAARRVLNDPPVAEDARR
jgi:hypothetical protein